MSRARNVANLGADTPNLEDISNAYSAGALSNRNKIINGAMVIDQRNAGAAVTTTSGYGGPDRWTLFASGGSLTRQQVAEAPAGFLNSLKFTTTTASAGAVWVVQQYVEGYNAADFDYGTATAKTATLSFWVQSSVTGKFSGHIGNGQVSARSLVFTYQISAANTWEYKTIVIAGDTTGTWLKNNGVGLKVLFNLGTGGGVGTENVWTSGDNVRTSDAVGIEGTLNATWQITGVQLEAGDTATPFEHRSYGQELALCQRYCRVDDMKGMAFGNLIPAGDDEFYLSRTVPNMRTAPTCTFPDGLPTSLQRGGYSLVGSVVTNLSTENSINLLFDTGTTAPVATYYANPSAGSFRIISASEL